MTPERWDRLDLIFEDALRAAPPDREAVLEAACAGDPGLRAEVDRLLADDARGRAEGFLAMPGDDASRSALARGLARLAEETGPPDPPPGGGARPETITHPSGSALDPISTLIGSAPRVLLRDAGPDDPPSWLIRPASSAMPEPCLPMGRLQLLGEIARGGMGAVLKGRDNDLGRDLAVKVLLERHGGSPELIRRFVEEAQIAGQLQHPGVVPVHELGVLPDLRPYFTMKLVKGRTLAEILAERPSPASGVSSLLAIYLDVAQAVAYAHARGVIHRDLKPSNVMVGSFGEVQVMDWGLAKILPRGGVADDAGAGRVEAHETVISTARSGSDSDLSLAGSVMGTPSYMAPEQARGEVDRVDERADVFALGSILCEILTGRPAFTGRTAGEIQRKAARGDTAEALGRLSASEADPELKGLARDCLAGELEDRPAHAGAVVDRVSGHLADVQARVHAAERDRAVAQAQAVEERRRRKLQAGLAASILALTALGGLGATSYVRQRQAREAAASRSLGEAETLLARAAASPEDLARWREATAAAARVEVAQVGDPAGRARLERIKAEASSGLDDAERDAALRQALVEIRANQLDVGDVETDSAYALAYREAGLDIDALSVAEAAARLRRRSPPVVVELASYLDHWSAVRTLAGRPVPDRRRLLEVARAADGDPYRDRIRSLLVSDDVKARAADLKALAEDARSANLPPSTTVLLAGSLVEPGAGVALLRKAVIRHPGDFWVNYALAQELEKLRGDGRGDILRYYGTARSIRPESSHRLAHALVAAGRGDEAEAEAVFRDLAARRPENPSHHACLGSFLKDRGRAGEAQIVLAVAMLAARKGVQRRPDDPVAHFRLAGALRSDGKLDEAVAEFREAIRLRPEFSSAHNNLGAALSDQGNPELAAVEYAEAIRLKPDNAEAHLNLALALIGRGKRDQAAAEIREAISINPNYDQAHFELGNDLRIRGNLDGSIAEFREAIRLNPGFTKARNNLALVLSDQGRLDEAVAEFREAIRIAPDDAISLNNLGNTLRLQRKLDEAVATCREAIRLRPDFPEAHLGLGNVLREQGKLDEAVAACREAIRLRPDEAGAQCNLGLALCSMGVYTEALATLRRGHEMGKKQPGWRYPSARWVAEAENLATLAERLPAILRGDDRPKDITERLSLAQICVVTRRFAAATRLWAEALEADPRLGNNRQAQHRYNAACAAALAAAGQGGEVPPPDDAAKAELRDRALGWLLAECDAWAMQVQPGQPKARSAVEQALRHWKADPDLAGVRDAEALKVLPEAERSRWRTLWGRVDDLLRGGMGAAPPKTAPNAGELPADPFAP